MKHPQQPCWPLLLITIAAASKTIVLYYAPGTGQVTIYKTNAYGTFAKVYSQSSSTPGFGAGNVDLTNPGDRVIAFDFLSNGKLDHLLCYRPNTGDVNPGLVSILQKNSDGTFQAVFTSNQGMGIITWLIRLIRSLHLIIRAPAS